MNEHTVELRVKNSNTKYEGFVSGNVQLSMEQCANTFSLLYADRTTLLGKSNPIEIGDDVEILIDGITILTGKVDEAVIEYSAESLSLQVSGRSKTSDVVDCSARHKSGQWKNQTLKKFAEDLCSPFGVGVRAETKDIGKKFDKIAIETGETCVEAIQRLARQRGLFPISLTDGSLGLVKIGSKKTKTVLRGGKATGNNIIKARRTESWQDRFSDYIFRGQRSGTDDTHGTASAHIRSIVQDDQLVKRGRYRPKVVVATGHDGTSGLEQMAKWERGRRLGMSERITLTVNGYKNDESELWQPNVLVTIDDDILRVKKELIVARVQYTFGATSEAGGYVTELELTHPEAFSQEPVPVRRRGSPITNQSKGFEFPPGQSSDKKKPYSLDINRAP